MRDHVPMQQAHLRRYQVALAFIAVVISAILAVLALEHSYADQHRQDKARIAAIADVTRRIERTAAETRALRRRQLAILHRQAVVGCHARHALVLVMTTVLERSLADSKALPIPGATPEQQAAIDERVKRGEAAAREGLRLARRADCHSIAPLPKEKS